MSIQSPSSDINRPVFSGGQPTELRGSPTLPINLRVPSLTYPPFEGGKTDLVGFINRTQPSQIQAELDEANSILNQYISEIPDLILSLERQFPKKKQKSSPPSLGQTTLKNSLKAAYPKAGSKEELEFLETVLPRSILQNPAMKGFFKKGYIRLELGEALMRASESQLNVLALIYKFKILKGARQTLSEIKIFYKKKPREETEEIVKAIKEWEIKLIQEESKIKADAIKFGVQFTGTTISYVDNFYKHFPFPVLLFNSRVAFNLLGTSSSILGLILAGINLKQKTTLAKTYRAWVEQAKKLHKPIYSNIANSAQAQLPLSKRVIQFSLDKKDVIKELDNLFYKSKNIDTIRKYLKNSGVALPSSIKSQIELQGKWAYSKTFKTLVVDQYVNYKQTFAHLNSIVETSQNLLEKRKAQFDIKLMQLKSQFEERIPQLQAFMNQSSFVKPLQEKLSAQFDQELESILAKAPSMRLEGVKANLEAIGVTLPKSIHSKQAAINYLTQAKAHPLEFSLLLKQWTWSKPRDIILKSYVDHQKTIEQTAKNAVKEIVIKKHEFEGKFINFKLLQSRVLFGTAALLLTTSAVMGIMAMVAFPIPAAVAILFWMSISSSALSFGLMAAGHCINMKYKALAPTFTETLKLNFMTLYANLQEYWHTSKQKQFFHTAQIIHQLHHQSGVKPEQYKEAVEKYKKAKSEFEASRKDFDHWMKKVHQIEDNLTRRAWKDFAHFARLSPDQFDTLQALEDAMQKCDLSLLDLDTKHFFEIQLGINLDAIQEELAHTPKVMVNALQNFFALQEEQLTSFMKYQQSRIEAGLIPVPSHGNT